MISTADASVVDYGNLQFDGRSTPSVINSRKESTGFNDPALRLLHRSLMLARGSRDPSGAPEIHELLTMCATLYPGRKGVRAR
jgi:hypothetical protein